MNIIEMKQKKLDLISSQRRLWDKADEEKRELTPEEKTEYRRLDGEVEQLEKDILAAEEAEEAKRKLAAREI